MRRRSVLALPGVLALAGCEVKAHAIPNFGLPPWHMWGTSQRITVPDVSAGTVFQTSQQLARVNYARPETWSFLFAVELLKVPEPNVGNLLVIVDYELITGIGRSNLKMPSTPNGQNTGFVRFLWSYPAGGPPPVPTRVKWTTTALAPVLDESIPAAPRLELEHFPAQDIQCNVQVNVTTAGGVVADTDTILAAHAYFAPRTHLRPEWFAKGQFRGSEQRGS